MANKTTQDSTHTKDTDAKIQQLQTQVVELENDWKRALADYQNLQKRFVEERQDIINYANSTLILKLLFVLDNLEMVAKHNNDQGLMLSIKTFKSVLEEENVEELNVENKNFDADVMDAIEKIPGPNNKVIEVLQKGYMFKGKILRPARVKVGDGSDKDSDSNN